MHFSENLNTPPPVSELYLTHQRYYSKAGDSDQLLYPGYKGR